MGTARKSDSVRNRIQSAITAGMAIICFSGCGTIITRSGVLGIGGGGDHLFPVYQATCLDSVVVFGPSSEPVRRQAAQRLVFLVDLPISVATDTIFLPFDLLPESRNLKSSRQSQDRKGAEQLCSPKEK
jgi:uncharacterized protein YceK